MKKLGLILAALLFISATTDKITDCMYNGKKLYGRVKVVSAHADFRVEVVDVGEDLRVRRVNGIASACGEWEFTDGIADFTIEYVTVGSDFRIRFVD